MHILLDKVFKGSTVRPLLTIQVQSTVGLILATVDPRGLPTANLRAYRSSLRLLTL